MSTRKNLVGTLHTGKFFTGIFPHEIFHFFEAALAQSRLCA
jgi:hypothetical protein